MNQGMISKRYAKALLLYAIDQKSEDRVFSEMKSLISSFVNEPKLRMAMDNPMVLPEDKIGLMKAAIGGKPSEEFSRFAELVVKNKREIYFKSIALSYVDLYCQNKNLISGKLITATPVDETTINKMKLLAQTAKNGSLDFETNVDPEIGGGFILYVDTYMMDASVSTQLRRIKQQLMIQNNKVM